MRQRLGNYLQIRLPHIRANDLDPDDKILFKHLKLIEKLLNCCLSAFFSNPKHAAASGVNLINKGEVIMAFLPLFRQRQVRLYCQGLDAEVHTTPPIPPPLQRSAMKCETVPQPVAMQSLLPSQQDISHNILSGGFFHHPMELFRQLHACSQDK